MAKTDNEYARALFELSIEEGSLEERKKDVETVLKVFEMHPEYAVMLASPVIPEKTGIDAVGEAFARLSSDTVKNFLKVICSKRKSKEIPQCMREFLALYMEYKKESRAVITSAFELTDEQKKRLCQRLEKINGVKIYPEYIIDASLVGGLTVSINGRLYDGSLRSRLEELKEVIEK